MKRQDRFGILGTPLLSDAGSQFKMSAQHKIAPTAVVYSNFRQKAVLRKERTLLDKTALLATRNDDLYLQSARPSHLEDVMDDEDRAYLRVRGMINRKKPDSEGQLCTTQVTETSFLTTFVDLPEIVPKQARTPLGYRELHTVYSLRRGGSSQIQQKAQTHSKYQGYRFFPHPSRVSKSGLGYCGKETTFRNTGDVESKRTSDTVGHRKDLERTNKGIDIRQDSDEEDYMDQLANSGYKNLDAAEKLMSQKLKEGLTSSTRTKRTRKRTLSGTGRANCKSFMFASFVEWRGLDKQGKEWTEYVVPARFAANPSRSSKKDRMKTNLNVLPPPLLQEYRELLQVHKENLNKEANNVKTSITKATQQQNAKLRRIRGLVLEDMGARFIGPQESQEAKIPTSLRSGRTKHTQNEDCSSRHPRQGQTNRTSQLWKPEKLLCKRLGVEVPKPSETSSEQVVKAPLKTFVVSPHQAEEFQIQSITKTDGRRIDISDGGSLLQDGIIVLGSDYDVKVGANNEKRPSRTLIQTIFANARIDEEGQLNCEQNASNEASNETMTGTKNETRGIHKTRAIDFF